MLRNLGNGIHVGFYVTQLTLESVNTMRLKSLIRKIRSVTG